MQEQVENRYLEAAVQTATPQKLRLMLIEGAIRFATAAGEAWDDPLPYSAYENARRCQKILAELYSVVRKGESEVAQRTADIYMFLYREAIGMIADGDRGKLDGILRVLEIERQTWQAVCEAMPEAPVREPGGESSGPQEITAAADAKCERATYSAPLEPPSTPSSSDGFSLEA